MTELDSENQNRFVKDIKNLVANEPVSRFFGFKILTLEPGYARVSMKMTAEYLNFNHVIFGGITMAVADQAFALAVNSANYPSVASHLSFYFTSTVQPTDEVIAECRLIKNGKRMGLSEITVTNQKGEVVAKGTGITIPVSSREAP